MLRNIPTHLIAGPLGAGKTTLIRQLLQQRPADERWAVLVNEFGQVGLDAALLGDVVEDAEGVQLHEVAGGCLCCVNGAPFQVGLGRLLQRSKPQRLLIEPSGLGHPAALLQQLQQAPWQGVLTVQPLLLVLDAAVLAAGQPLPEAQQAALPLAGLLVLNKSAGLDAAQRQQIAAQLPPLPLYWTEQGQLPLDALPQQVATQEIHRPEAALPNGPAPLPTLFCDAKTPLLLPQQTADGWSLGWRWHPSQRFDLQRLAQWLAAAPWQRAKLIVQAADGQFYSANLLSGQPLQWQPSQWRRDSRLELLGPGQAPGAADLQAALAACRVTKAD